MTIICVVLNFESFTLLTQSSWNFSSSSNVAISFLRLLNSIVNKSQIFWYYIKCLFNIIEFKSKIDFKLFSTVISTLPLPIGIVLEIQFLFIFIKTCLDIKINDCLWILILIHKICWKGESKHLKTCHLLGINHLRKHHIAEFICIYVNILPFLW